MRLLWISSVEITTQYHCKGNQNRLKNQHENAVLDGKFIPLCLTLLNVILISQ